MSAEVLRYSAFTVDGAGADVHTLDGRADAARRESLRPGTTRTPAAA